MRDNQSLAEEMERIKQINMEKEYFVQITKMIIALRDGCIAKMTKQAGNSNNLGQEEEEEVNLQKEISLLKLQLQHDPRLLEKEVENIQLAGTPNYFGFVKSINSFDLQYRIIDSI